MQNEIFIQGKKFKKSSFSGVMHNCVGVSFEKDHILLTNTENPTVMIKFSVEEWQAFLKGVKNGEFDI